MGGRGGWGLTKDGFGEAYDLVFLLIKVVLGGGFLVNKVEYYTF